MVEKRFHLKNKILKKPWMKEELLKIQETVTRLREEFLSDGCAETSPIGHGCSLDPPVRGVHAEGTHDGTLPVLWNVEQKCSVQYVLVSSVVVSSLTAEEIKWWTFSNI